MREERLPVMEFGSTGVSARGRSGVQRMGVARKRERNAESCIATEDFLKPSSYPKGGLSIGKI